MKQFCVPAVVAVAACCCGSLEAGVGSLTVASVQPAAHALTASRTSGVSVTFDQPVDTASVTPMSFWAFGRWSGPADGSFSFSNADTTVTLTPDDAFFTGEQVMVILSHDLRAASGDPIRTAGYSWQFWTEAGGASMVFSELDQLRVRSDVAVGTRAYGGIATDLNNDGWADITIVNEDSFDLRVFMNKADGTGNFDGFLQPTHPIGQQGSPNEPSDFNRDGNADIAVANILSDTISVLLGNGDGTYAPQQVIAAGNAPRGLVVLDADGDGDTDIVVTNFNTGNMAIFFNDGNGLFSGPTFFEGGGSGEWALGTADMNDDGILDLVVGFRGSNTVVIDTGNGDGTFSIGASAPAGGGPWMLNVADIDGNGTEDVVTANATQNVGGVLLGDGSGGLVFDSTHVTDSFPLATDLGDLDGDGDLDWVVSSFSGDWFCFENVGGTFLFDQEFLAPLAASCALMVDIDNDCDLDLALIDELRDVVILQINGGSTPPTGDLDGDCQVGITDLLLLLAAWGPCDAPCPPTCSGDIDDDCAVGITDLLSLLSGWS